MLYNVSSLHSLGCKDSSKMIILSCIRLEITALFMSPLQICFISNFLVYCTGSYHSGVIQNQQLQQLQPFVKWLYPHSHNNCLQNIARGRIEWEASQHKRHQKEMDEDSENFTNFGGDTIFLREDEDQSTDESSENESAEREPRRKRTKASDRGPFHSPKQPRKTTYKVGTI